MKSSSTVGITLTIGRYFIQSHFKSSELSLQAYIRVATVALMNEKAELKDTKLL